MSASNANGGLATQTLTHNVVELPSSPTFAAAIPTILFPFPQTAIGFSFAAGTQLTVQGSLNGTSASNCSYNSSSRSGVLLFPAGTVSAPGDFQLQLLYVSPLINPATINVIVAVDTIVPAAALVGAPIALLPTSDPNVANHFVALRFAMCYASGSLTPYRQWMNVSFGDGTALEALSFQCDSSQSIAQCPANYSFCAYTPSRNYSTTGNITASVTIYNALSNRTAAFNFFVYSQITGLSESLYVIPVGENQAAPNASDYWPLMNTPYYPLEQSIWLVAHMSYGSETPVTYWWDFGDGNSTVTPNPYTQHSYSSPGLYMISLNVSNPLSSAQTALVANQQSAGASVTGYILVQRCAH